MPEPIVSIVLPIYNAEKYIDKTIQAVEKQSVEGWELLIIDDGSTDSSMELVTKYTIRNSRIRIFSQPNSGPSSARNLGIKNAIGKYITFIDADDTVEPFYLKSLLEVIERDSEVELVCAGYYEQSIYHKDGLPLHDFEKFRPREIIKQEEFIGNLLNGVTGVLWAKLFITEVIRKNDLRLPTNLKLSEDLIFVAKYVKLIDKVAITYDHIYFYNRVSESGLSRRYDESYFSEFIKFRDLILKEFPDNVDVNYKIHNKIADQLKKTLRDQSISPKNLKYYHHIILKKFGTQSLDGTRSILDRIYLGLIEGKFYTLAFLHIKIYQLLQKIRHA